MGDESLVNCMWRGWWVLFKKMNLYRSLIIDSGLIWDEEYYVLNFI